jgi:hypothetical protein
MTLARDPPVAMRRFSLFLDEIGLADFSISIGIHHAGGLVNRFFHNSARAMSIPFTGWRIQSAAIINAHSSCARTPPLRETHRLRGDLEHQPPEAGSLPSGVAEG